MQKLILVYVTLFACSFFSWTNITHSKENGIPYDLVDPGPPVWTDTALALSYDGPPKPPDPPPPPPEPEPEPEQPVANHTPPPPPRFYEGGDVRSRALNRLAVLGAVQWQLNVFDCLGWAESGWQSKRSNQINSNGTWDHGPFQINDIHGPRLNSLGLDPYVPEQAADYVWLISSGGTNFRPWSTRYKCGV